MKNTNKEGFTLTEVKDALLLVRVWRLSKQRRRLKEKKKVLDTHNTFFHTLLVGSTPVFIIGMLLVVVNFSMLHIYYNVTIEYMLENLGLAGYTVAILGLYCALQILASRMTFMYNKLENPKNRKRA